MIDKLIKHMRKVSGHSQMELAKKVGIASSTLSGYEIKNAMPNFDIVEKIANACEFDIVFIDRNNGEKINIDNI